MYNREEATLIMNNWGKSKIPFFFIIDFNMESILLIKMDSDFPDSIFYSFPEISQNDVYPVLHPSFYFNRFPVEEKIYKTAFDKVLFNINSGNSFLLNLTFPTKIETSLSLYDIYHLSNAKYKLLVKDEFVVFSPETFVKITDGIIYSNPMKGTISADVENAEKEILSDSKEMAEHYTIVDLIRNDLSIVAKNVHVNRFRYTELINTNFGGIIQVSSEITGELPQDYNCNIGTILFSLLPAGSVTGAPKPKTVEIIKEVETDNRGYYTGIFGYFDGNNLESAVNIRFIEKKQDGLWFRSGGGITFQSNLTDEYNELIKKVYVPFPGNDKN